MRPGRAEIGLFQYNHTEEICIKIRPNYYFLESKIVLDLVFGVFGLSALAVKSFGFQPRGQGILL